MHNFTQSINHYNISKKNVTNVRHQTKKRSLTQNDIEPIMANGSFNCSVFHSFSAATHSSELFDFPTGLYTLDQLRHGGIAIHILVAIYMLVAVEHVCDEYFMPAVEYIAFERCRLSGSAAGALILAGASSFTELCASTVGVLFTKSDLAINLVLGSGAYNLLVITGVSSIAVHRLALRLCVHAVLRDALFYAIALLILLACLSKNGFEKLRWYDSLIALGWYSLFVLANVFDLRKWMPSRTKSQHQKDVAQIAASDPIEMDQLRRGDATSTTSSDDSQPYDPFKDYRNFASKSAIRKSALCVVAPVRLVAYLIIVDFRRFGVKKRPALAIATLMSSACFTAACSYVFIGMMVTACHTFGLSETFVGFVLIAAATGVEETVASIVLCKRQLDKARRERETEAESSNRKQTSSFIDMIVGNSIGSNMFDLSIGIGLPYAFHSLVLTGGQGFTRVYAPFSVIFVTFGLLCALGVFTVALVVFKFRFTIGLGVSCLIIWICLQYNALLWSFYANRLC